MYRIRCQAVTSFAFRKETERAQQLPSTFRFTYAHTSSIGFNSGAYGGKNTKDRRFTVPEMVYGESASAGRVVPQRGAEFLALPGCGPINRRRQHTVCCRRPAPRLRGAQGAHKIRQQFLGLLVPRAQVHHAKRGPVLHGRHLLIILAQLQVRVQAVLDVTAVRASDFF
jgi:hypothetical protein